MSMRCPHNNMRKQKYLIQLTLTRTFNNKPYYIMAYNIDTGFMGSTDERKEARVYEYEDAVQVCYAISLRFKGTEIPLMVKR